MKKYLGTIAQIHFAVLFSLILFYLIGLLLHYELRHVIKYFLKGGLLLSGLILFFLNLSPFRKRALYFIYYVLGPILSLIAWCFDGIFGAIIASLFFFWVIPNSKHFENEKYVVYSKFQGFMSVCCTYEVYEKGFLFDKKITEFQLSSDEELKTEMNQFK